MANKKCPDANLLAGYLDGGLLPEEKEVVVIHLLVCPSCRQVVVACVRLDARVRQARERVWQWN